MKKITQICLIKATTTAVLLAMPAAAMAQRGDENSVPQQINTTDRLIIRSADDSPAKRASLQAADAEMLKAIGLGDNVKVVDRSYDGALIVKLDRRVAVPELEAKLRSAQRSGSSIVPDYPVSIHGLTPTDPNYGSSWGLQNPTGGINAPLGWNASLGASASIAVLDTGTLKHPDLFGTVNPLAQKIAASAMPVPGGATVLNPIMMGPITVSSFVLDNNSNIYGYDFVSNDADPTDPGDWTTANQCWPGSPAANSSWHGTHVSGIASALTNTQGSLGASPSAKVLPIRVLGTCGGNMSNIEKGIIWAAGGGVGTVSVNPKPADIINMSLGGQSSCPTSLQNAINIAFNRGTTIVVSAGNSNMNASLFAPANCANVITVAANAINGSKPGWSNFGAVDLAAPGALIYSTLNSGTTVASAHSYANYNGTSMAAPFVSSIGAAISSIRPDLSPATIETIIKNNSRPLISSCAGQCGSGYADMNNALNAAIAVALPSITSETNVPNETIATALSMGVMTGTRTLKGNIGPLGGVGADQRDFWAFTVPAYGRLQAVPAPIGGAAIPVVEIVTAGNIVVSRANSQGTSHRAKASWFNPTNAPVQMYVRVMAPGMTPTSYGIIVKNQ